MLQRLSIQHYAIIDELELVLSPKMNVITGETGAGKSILMGALSLILGERADSSVISSNGKDGGTQKCIVEGQFDIAGRSDIREWLRAQELDEEAELVIRREIAPSGKSRAFINDTPVLLSQLQQVCSFLVDLHQQFDNQEISETDFQRTVIDALAANQTLRQEYASVFSLWQQHRKEGEEMLRTKQQFDREADYNRFQYQELADAGFRPNELEDIAAELKLMSHAEGIKAMLDKTCMELEGNDQPIVQQLKSLLNQLAPYNTMHPALPAIYQRLAAAQVEIKDIAGDLDHLAQQVHFDPEKNEQYNERLSLGYKLQKKHGVQSTDELIAIQTGLQEKLQAVLHIDEAIRANEIKTKELYDKAEALAKQIHASRKKQVKPLEDHVNALLVRVGMPNARLKVELTPTELHATGADNVEFLFNANIPAGSNLKQASFQPVRKVASGGELSRLMLCIKSLVAASVDLPTLIFDEIDTGISGEAARQVGAIMQELASKRQVVCITHQPQIAGRADTHFFVYKQIEGDRVVSHIRQLSKEERITTIAQMLSGEKPTAAALQNAREMVMN